MSPYASRTLYGCAFVVVLMVPLAGSAAAQSAAQASPTPIPAQTGAIVRTTTRLVQLDVIVEDTKGRPVLDLKKEDFTLLDEGTHEELAIFSPSASVQQRARNSSHPPNVFDN